MNDAEQAAWRVGTGARMRRTRKARGLTLDGVQEKSDGRFRAVVVGSWERGQRAVQLEQAVALAGFYGVPVTAFLPPANAAEIEPEPPTALGLVGEALAILDDARKLLSETREEVPR